LAEFANASLLPTNSPPDDAIKTANVQCILASYSHIVTELAWFLLNPGFLQVRENWKMSENLCCQGKSGKFQGKILF